MNVVIMAGGSGTRFWPRSREKHSKQFLNIFGKDSLIQSTIKRFAGIVGADHIYIVAKESQKDLVKIHKGKVPDENCIYEPIGRNTAPCIGLAALMIQRKDPDSVMVVTPADHLVADESLFKRVVQAGMIVAEKKDGLVTIGIKPDRPATGYGYIQMNGEHESISGIDTYKIKTFAEKPNLATAQRFLGSGDFFWNSGIFMFKTTVILETIENLLPDLFDSLLEIGDALDTNDFNKTFDRVYHQIKGVSIDYGIMEQVENAYMIKGEFTWNDLGSWEQVYKISDMDQNHNVKIGKVIAIDTQNTYISSNKGLIATVGVEDLIIVKEDDMILICKLDKSEDVKKVVERLKHGEYKIYQ